MHSCKRCIKDSPDMLESFLHTCDERLYPDEHFLYYALSVLFSGFMSSSFCVGKPPVYFYRHISTLREMACFGGFCAAISETDDLRALWQEGVMSKWFYRFQKLAFGLCGRGRDRAAGALMWVCAKLLYLKKRVLPSLLGRL